MATFGLSVMTFYTFYRCYFQKFEVHKNHLLSMFEWFILYLLFTLIVVYAAVQVTREVSVYFKIVQITLKLFSIWVFHKKMLKIQYSNRFIHFISLQGKATFHIAHEIINESAEIDINLSVCDSEHSNFYVIDESPH